MIWFKLENKNGVYFPYLNSYLRVPQPSPHPCMCMSQEFFEKDKVGKMPQLFKEPKVFTCHIHFRMFSFDKFIKFSFLFR